MFPQARRRRSDRSESAARGLHFLELGPELLYARPSRRLCGLALNFFLSLRANVEVADDEIFHKPAGELSREQKLSRPKRPEARGNRPTARAFRSTPRLRAGRSLAERSRRKGAVVANATGSFQALASVPGLGDVSARILVSSAVSTRAQSASSLRQLRSVVPNPNCKR